jgi:hypothetical protein
MCGFYFFIFVRPMNAVSVLAACTLGRASASCPLLPLAVRTGGVSGHVRAVQRQSLSSQKRLVVRASDVLGQVQKYQGLGAQQCHQIAGTGYIKRALCTARHELLLVCLDGATSISR